MSIKDFPVRVTKKNKTRGRPSKSELFMSEFASYFLKENQAEINKAILDNILYGTGCLLVKNGKANAITF